MFCWNLSDKTKEFPALEQRSDVQRVNIFNTYAISALRWVETGRSAQFKKNKTKTTVFSICCIDKNHLTSYNNPKMLLVRKRTAEWEKYN